MSLFSLRRFPDRVLRKISEPVSKVDRGVRKFIDRLIETMRSQPGGIGIAAPQVGVLKRIAIVDVSKRDPSKKQLILINPIIRSQKQAAISREGCMSLPDFTANVQRYRSIEVCWHDIQMKEHVMWTDGIEAICIQHELDHLNGLLFLDRVTSLKSDVFPRKHYL